jgi:hypothetical protein
LLLPFSTSPQPVSFIPSIPRWLLVLSIISSLQHLGLQICSFPLLSANPSCLSGAGVCKGQSSQLQPTTFFCLPSSDLLPSQTEAGDAATDSARFVGFLLGFFFFFFPPSHLGHGT